MTIYDILGVLYIQSKAAGHMLHRVYVTQDTIRGVSQSVNQLVSHSPSESIQT